MAKNILLLFLSDVKTAVVDGKISVSKARYEKIDGAEILTTSESAIRYLSEKNFALDKIFILASQKIRKPIRGFEPSQTHLEFFLERVKNFLPNVACDIYDYDENQSGDENLKSVAEVSERIQNFAADDEVKLHVDLTGGMRDVNMMMLDLTRLLEYSGLTVDKILYTKFNSVDKTVSVAEVKNIYDLFQLIAGVEEFVNFGSVTALKSYYDGKKLSAPLKKLLTAMENFAEAIKLCHYKKFSDAIINLHDAVHDFAPATNDLQDILMARLIGRIREDYRQLIINRELDDLRVIRWCLSHDYLQQALILYTERIPEYFGSKKFLTLSAKHEKILANELEKDKMGRHKFYFLLNVYSPDLKRYDGFGKYCTLVKDDAITDIRKKRFDYDTWLKKFDGEKFNEEKFSFEDEPRLRLQLANLEKIWKTPALLDDLSAAELEPLRKLIDEFAAELEEIPAGFQRAKKLFDEIGQLSKESDGSKSKRKLFKDFFQGVVFAKGIAEKYHPNAVTISEMLEAEIFSVAGTKEDFLSIMGKYFRIRDERNYSAHAKEKAGEFETASELKKFLLDALTEIEKFLPATM